MNKRTRDKKSSLKECKEDLARLKTLQERIPLLKAEIEEKEKSVKNILSELKPVIASDIVDLMRKIEKSPFWDEAFLGSMLYHWKFKQVGLNNITILLCADATLSIKRVQEGLKKTFQGEVLGKIRELESKHGIKFSFEADTVFAK